jgi:hypothetical protein
MKTYLKLIIAGLILLNQFACTSKNSFKLQSGSPIIISYNAEAEEKVTTNALQLLQGDINTVLSVVPEITAEESGNIWIGTIDKSPLIQKLVSENLISISELEGKNDAFQISVVNINEKPTLVVAGSDRRGTAYGLLEISRLMGVSPWEWWADVTPQPLREFVLNANFKTIQSPSVPYRGIFLNDEDWGLLPWSSQTYEPGLPTAGGRTKGAIGPKSYERIFQLLLRLRANTIWPAMHECTVPYFLVEGNREMAHDYAIYIGGSHCEPMMRSVAGEWAIEGEGAYDYVNNSENVYKFFEKRVAEVAHLDNIYTLGMRGVHDGQMRGAKTIEEQKNVLMRVFEDQRSLLKEYVNEDLEKIPQVFIPYKEVLDIYNTGLPVEDDITLMWCDDNYGYIKHFPTEDELKRKGGHGVYYHVSYWGRPHDYLWLGTASPALLYQQMKLAYEKGVQEMWILNVGDIKPCEYQTELFLDMAWDFNSVISKGLDAHMKTYLQREFGDKIGKQLLPIMNEHYRLAYIRKPEFMGNTREEEWDNRTAQIVKNLPWSEEEVRERLQAYRKISDEVERIGEKIPAKLQDAYFELIKYPVQATAQMNYKLLNAQLARHGKAEWTKSDLAYDSIVSLTQQYNSLADGKWYRMMDHQPRKLPPFKPVKHEEDNLPYPEYKKPLYVFNGADYSTTTAVQCFPENLGYEEKALAIRQGSTISFKLKKLSTDSITIEVRLLPNHPVKGDKLRFGIALDNSSMQEISYETYGRSEEWKQNVLRNQAIRRVKLPVINKSATLNIKAIDEGVVLDQVLVYDN